MGCELDGGFPGNYDDRDKDKIDDLLVSDRTTRTANYKP